MLPLVVQLGRYGGLILMSNRIPARDPQQAGLHSMKWPLPAGIGLAAGVLIAAVDNFSLNGEVSPIVIVAMLFVTTAIAGVICGRRGWVVSGAGWVCVPLAHLIKHILDLPDTLHPNTYTSILMLAAFTFGVAAIGTACGVVLRSFITGAMKGTL